MSISLDNLHPVGNHASSVATAKQLGLRVLFLGEDWHGSNATSLKRAFRALGCDVFNIDDYHFYPQWHSNSLRLLRMLGRRVISAEFSAHVARVTEQFNPHLVFV